MRRALPFLLLLVALVALPAQAGTPGAPEVTDPAGDVAAFGVPAPAGFGWGDLEAAWFAHDGEGLVLTIDVGDGAGAPPVGEVGLTFLVGEQHFIAGYTVVPGLYSGGFLSRSDEAGDVPAGVSPEAMPGTFADGRIEVRFPVAAVDPDGASGALASPWGWSESQASNGETYRLDGTEPGAGFAWAAPAGAAADGADGVDGTGGPGGADRQDAPALPWLAAAAALALAAAVRRR